MLGDREHNITTTAAAKLDSVTHLRKMFVCLGKNIVCVYACVVCACGSAYVSFIHDGIL